MPCGDVATGESLVIPGEAIDETVVTKVEVRYDTLETTLEEKTCAVLFDNSEVVSGINKLFTVALIIADVIFGINKLFTVALIIADVIFGINKLFTVALIIADVIFGTTIVSNDEVNKVVLFTEENSIGLDRISSVLLGVTTKTVELLIGSAVVSIRELGMVIELKPVNDEDIVTVLFCGVGAKEDLLIMLVLFTEVASPELTTNPDVVLNDRDSGEILNRDGLITLVLFALVSVELVIIPVVLFSDSVTIEANADGPVKDVLFAELASVGLMTNPVVTFSDSLTVDEVNTDGLIKNVLFTEASIVDVMTNSVVTFNDNVTVDAANAD